MRWLQSRNAAALAALDAGTPGVVRAELRRARLQLASTRAVLRRAAEDGDAAPALLPRQMVLLGRVERLQASVAGAVERRGAADSQITADSKSALEQARVALDELAASLEAAAGP